MSKKALTEVGNRRRSDRLKLLTVNGTNNEDNNTEVPKNPRVLLPAEM